MSGNPSVDTTYTQRHPDWRHSYHEMKTDLLDQLVTDREVGRKVEQDRDRWVHSADLGMSELVEIADRRARQVLEEAIRQHEDPIEAGRGLGVLE